MDKFVDLLGSALAKFGVAATYMWPKAVLYVLVNTICSLIGWGLFGALLVYGSHLLWQRADYREKKGIYDSDATGGCRVFSWILFFLGPLVILFAVFGNIATFVSPEYATVLSLISAAMGK